MSKKIRQKFLEAVKRAWRNNKEVKFEITALDSSAIILETEIDGKKYVLGVYKWKVKEVEGK